MKISSVNEGGEAVLKNNQRRGSKYGIVRVRCSPNRIEPEGSILNLGYEHPLKQLLKRRGKSVKWLAQQCQVSTAYIYAIMSGKRTINLNQRCSFTLKLKAALDATSTDLVLGPNE